MTMRSLPSLLRAAALGAALSASPAVALPLDPPATVDLYRTVQADCYAVGQQVAAQNGGTLARATPRQQGGQTVCVIVVLMPAKDGQRPRRAEFVVPAG